MDTNNAQVEPTIEHDVSYRSDSIVPQASEPGRALRWPCSTKTQGEAAASGRARRGGVSLLL
jgi:hypothetical protein